MKFCPKCSGLLLPVKKGDKTILKCQRCGYEEELKKADVNGYVDKKNIEKKGAVIVDRYTTLGLGEEEKELREDYVKQLLENLSEAEREGEEE